MTAAIVGASGFTGVELVKLLVNHPKIEIGGLYGSDGGERIEELYPAFRGLFEASIHPFDPERVEGDIIFLALPHSRSMEVAGKLLDRGLRVVDLSADYRLSLEHYEAFYTRHLDPGHLQEAVYGLPELWREKIEVAPLVANPGCYPTAAILSLAPFLPYIDRSMPIFIDAKSGVSGAGKRCSAKTHFCTIDENIFPYNPLRHRHSIEIKEQLEILGKEPIELHFVPHLIPINRGMLVNSFLSLTHPLDPIEVLQEFYAQEPFVRIAREPVDVKSVAGTHFCDIFAMAQGKRLFVSAAIDNLLRGAASQAVANANLMLSLEEDLGLPKLAYIP
ncbi:MAG: N-acetyl-gamma-glutamyl-phosphate reductase [Nitratiruptor sp.]|nr:N-acetyl-gamma-glutamyl-phosphate reductase [Nitratiruptor sp.]NPA84211.1 N-acetyl-gamma-glutamyl-phosphate reductase [Campylobacterota bacterium]